MKPKSITERTLLAALLASLGATLFSAGMTVVPASAQLDLSILDGLEEDGVPSCGVVLEADVELNSDLTCDGTALIAGADDITIDLFGYTISANGENGVNLSVDFTDDCGIKVANQDDVTIVGPGRISGFDRAICFEGAGGNSSVSDVILDDNEAAIIVYGSDGVNIEQVKIDNNDFGIVAQSSADGEIIFNLIGENTEQGVVLLNADGWTIAGNSIIDNGENGIFLDAQSNNNIVDFNNIFGHDTDLNNANGVPPDINDNTFGSSNNCDTSLPGGLC